MAAGRFYTYNELQDEIIRLSKENELYNRRISQLENKVQGEGVIVLSGNRLKIDRSGSISDYQLKST